MKSTIRSTAELARELGVSRWTVSRALNGHAGVDPATAERIKETASRHGFAPSLLGRGLRSGRTDQAGICLPDLVDYFLTTKITRLQQALQARGFHPVLQILDGRPETENAALERFAAMRCAGVVVIASQLDESAAGFRSLAAAEIPLVRIDPLNLRSPASVSSDRRAAMRLAVRHLHTLGHRRLVVAGLDRESPYGRQRLEGLRTGCRTLKWDFERDVRILPLPETRDDFSAGRVMAETFLKDPSGTSAILAINDRIALGLVRTLQDHGWHVPGDVSVIGYDNADFSPYASPALTTLDPQVDQLIEHAVRLLVPHGPADRPPGAGGTLIKPRLVRRASDGPPPRTKQTGRKASAMP